MNASREIFTTRPCVQKSIQSYCACWQMMLLLVHGRSCAEYHSQVFGQRLYSCIVRWHSFARIYYCSNEYRKDREWEIILKYDFLLSNQTWILFTWVPSRKERRPDAWLIWKKTPIFTSISLVIFVTYTKRQSVSMH